MAKAKKPPKMKVPLVGFNGRVELAVVEVADPYERGKKLRVMRNVAARPIDMLHARGKLDDAHKLAADRLERLLEDAEIGGAKAIDYSAVKVDTSRGAAGVSDRVIRADKELAHIRHDLGRRQYDFICRVLLSGGTVYQLASELDGGRLASRRTRDFVADTIRRILDDLVLLFGVGEGRKTGRIRVMLATSESDA